MLKKLSKALKHPKEDTKSHQSTSSLTGSVSNASLVPQEDASQHAVSCIVNQLFSLCAANRSEWV